MKRQAAARKQGRLYGLGAVSVIEIAGGPSGRPAEEAREIRFDATGSATFFIGGHNHGQGHETTFRQIAHHALGLLPDQVNVDLRRHRQGVPRPRHFRLAHHVERRHRA